MRVAFCWIRPCPLTLPTSLGISPCVHTPRFVRRPTWVMRASTCSDLRTALEWALLSLLLQGRALGSAGLQNGLVVLVVLALVRV